ncbi:hypothetical protein Tco_1108542 [Tanacetum coccineum]
MRIHALEAGARVDTLEDTAICKAVKSDSEHSTMSYTFISSDSDPSAWGIPLMDADEVYIPEIVYPEYLAPSDDDIPVEDQPLPADASPAALSPGYVAYSDPEEDHVVCPADEGDDDDEDDDDEEEQEASDEEEERLAPTDSFVVPIVDHVPSAKDT